MSTSEFTVRLLKSKLNDLEGNDPIGQDSAITNINDRIAFASETLRRLEQDKKDLIALIEDIKESIIRLEDTDDLPAIES